MSKNKLGFLQGAEMRDNGSAAGPVRGYWRDSFSRFQARYDQAGELARKEIRRRQPGRKKRAAAEGAPAVGALAIEAPAQGPVRVCQERHKRGLRLSPSAVRSLGLRHDLPRFALRGKALETQLARQPGRILTEAPGPAREKARQEQEAGGEIETAPAGYLGAPDPDSVGTLQSIAGIDQQTVMDPYSQVARGKRQDRQKALLAADRLPERGRPFCEQPPIPLPRRLPAGGTEYGGHGAPHEYPRYRALENIDQTKTQARRPPTNGLGQRCPRTRQNECSGLAFRKKRYRRVEQLPAEADSWIGEYPENRPHSGKYGFGKTPGQTVGEAKPLAQEKPLDHRTVPAASDHLVPSSASGSVA